MAVGLKHAGRHFVLHGPVTNAVWVIQRGHFQSVIISLNLICATWVSLAQNGLLFQAGDVKHTSGQKVINSLTRVPFYCGIRTVKPAGRGFDSRWCHWNFQ